MQMEPKNLKPSLIVYLFSFILSSCISAQDIDNNIINDAKKTHILKINNENRFKKIPKKVFDLKDLKVFSFTGTECDISEQECNNISEIPKNISNLSKLDELYLVMNNIKSVPLEINNLQSLKILDLSNNKDIDISNIKIVNLEILNINGCDLKQIPPNIFNLKKLKVLGLEENNISEDEINRLKEAISDCQIYW